MADRLIIASLPGIAALVIGINWDRGGLPDWFGIFRTVMMALGGLVVTAIVLVVAIAIVSGVMGMVGNLRKRSK